MATRPKIVLGLGNPGVRYRGTRHNLGFRVVERLASHAGSSFGEPSELAGQAWTAVAGGEERPLVLAKPRTYMNRSGQAALALLTAFEAGPADLLVVYDDADLELGRVRLRPAGGAGGHNGLRSLIDVLRTDAIARLRLGVRGEQRDVEDLAEYVLAPFEPEEEPAAERLVQLGAEAVSSVLEDGLQAAMNRYNARLVSENKPEASEEEG